MTSNRRLLVAALSSATLIATVLTMPTAATAATTSDQDLAGWAFQEDVDLSDSSRWKLETGQAANTLSYDLPANVSFSEKGLTVVGKNTAVGSSAYSSGDARGTGISIPNYARVEAVGTVPVAEGLWPALLWLRPLDSNHGEIDLMEVFGAAKAVTATIHNQYGSGHKSTKGTAKWTSLANPSPTAVHTYVMEKSPDSIVISVDGVVMLDVGPEDVPTGFDWDAMFERTSATWYPRVTMQIGCGASLTGCTVGTPAVTWRSSSITLQSLKIWKWSPSTTAPTTSETVTPTPVETVTPTPVETVTPTPVETVTPAPVDTTPPAPAETETPVTPAVESGSPLLIPGKIEQHEHSSTTTDREDVTAVFSVPKTLNSGVLYGSLDLVTPGDNEVGYRATVAIKSSGSLYLTLYRLQGGRSYPVDQQWLAPAGHYTNGDSIQVVLANDGSTVSAKAWVVGNKEPASQVSATTATPIAAGAVARVVTYLSKSAPHSVIANWSGFTLLD
ncbi:MAG: family 16 glycosylhydrolase [Microbacterium sp.]